MPQSERFHQEIEEVLAAGAAEQPWLPLFEPLLSKEQISHIQLKKPYFEIREAIRERIDGFIEDRYPDQQVDILRSLERLLQYTDAKIKECGGTNYCISPMTMDIIAWGNFNQAAVILLNILINIATDKPYYCTLLVNNDKRIDLKTSIGSDYTLTESTVATMLVGNQKFTWINNELTINSPLPETIGHNLEGKTIDELIDLPFLIGKNIKINRFRIRTGYSYVTTDYNTTEPDRIHIPGYVEAELEKYVFNTHAFHRY